MNTSRTDVLYCPESLEHPELFRQQQERKAVNNLLRELARAHKLLPRKTILAALQVAALLSLRANPPCPGRGGAFGPVQRPARLEKRQVGVLCLLPRPPAGPFRPGLGPGRPHLYDLGPALGGMKLQKV